MPPLDPGDHSNTWNEKATIIAGAITALVVIGWMIFIAIAVMAA